MPLVQKETTTGLPVDEEDSSVLGTPGTPSAQAPEAADAARVPQQSRGERETSFDLEHFPVPQGREEDWRFTPVDRLQGLFEPHPGTGSVTEDLPEGVTSARVPMGELRAGSAFRPADRAAVAGWNATSDAHVVTVASEARVERPVVLELTGERGVRANEHVVVDVGAFAEVTIVLRHVGSAEFLGNVEVRAGDSSSVTLVSLQEWEDDALHLGQHDLVVGRDARVRHIAVTLGGDIVRVCTNVRYTGPGGDAECLGVYFADADQHLEHRLFVDHEATNCRSNVVYKGALQGESAHTVWVGDVLIRSAATGTDTYELNRNLVLTDGARADSVPNLEIETGEIVGAGHASATGRFDDEQLFYLRSRGIPEEQARRLVVRGFFADIVQRIGLPEVSDRLMELVDEELELSVGAAGGSAVGNVVEEATS